MLVHFGSGGKKQPPEIWRRRKTNLEAAGPGWADPLSFTHSHSDSSVSDGSLPGHLLLLYTVQDGPTRLPVMILYGRGKRRCAACQANLTYYHHYHYDYDTILYYYSRL